MTRWRFILGECWWFGFKMTLRLMYLNIWSQATAQLRKAMESLDSWTFYLLSECACNMSIALLPCCHTFPGSRNISLKRKPKLILLFLTGCFIIATGKVTAWRNNIVYLYSRSTYNQGIMSLWKAPKPLPQWKLPETKVLPMNKNHHHESPPV